MKKRNYVLLILGIVCSMSVFTACGKTGDAARTNSADVEGEASEDDKSSAPQEETTEPTPTETPVQMITADPEPDVQEQTPSGMNVEAMDGQYYVVIGANVRSDSNPESDLLGGLFVGDTAHVTGVCENGWYRITYNDSTGYVFGNSLSETAPVISYGGSNQDYDSDDSDEE